MLSDMKNSVTVNLCISDFDILSLYKNMSSLYFGLFTKLFKLQFLSAHGDFILLDPLKFGDPGIVNGRSFYAVNCTMVLSRSNCRSLLALIHAINIRAANEKSNGFVDTYSDLDYLAFRFTKILLYKY